MKRNFLLVTEIYSEQKGNHLLVNYKRIRQYMYIISQQKHGPWLFLSHNKYIMLRTQSKVFTINIAIKYKQSGEADKVKINFL